MRTTVIAFLGLSFLAACGPIGGVEGDDGAGGSAGVGSGGSAGTGLAGAANVRPPNPHNRQSLVWVWENYQPSLSFVVKNQNSFTHVSPALYQMNYAYQSGVAQDEVPGGNYGGALNGKTMASLLHGAGIKIVPLMYAGAGNNGVDDGIINVLTNPTIAQSFIDAHVQEAVDKDYDGWNLDWEVGDKVTGQYSTQLISFLTSFKQALNAHGMVLSYDLGGWYVKQCSASGYSGVVDMTAMGAAVDQAIIEDYAKTLDGPLQNCPTPAPTQLNCDSFGSQLQLMCATTPSTVSIGLISPDSNAFAPQALQAISSYGYQSVAVWPDDSGFLNATGMPNGDTWYSVLAAWLAN